MSRDFNEAIKDYANLFQSNTFINKFAKEQGSKNPQVNRKSIYAQIRKYINSFKNSNNQDLIYNLKLHTVRYEILEECTTKLSTGNFDPKQIGQLTNKFDRTYDKLTEPGSSFSELFDIFLQNVKGISQGDDELRMLKSMVSTAENIQNSRQADLDFIKGYSEWKKDADVTDSKEAMFNADMDKYSRECQTYKVNNLHPESTLQSSHEILVELQEELDDISTKESQTYNEKAYNDCNDRINAYQESFEELSKQQAELLGRQTVLMDAENRFSLIANEITKQNIKIKEYELQSRDIQIELNEIEPQLANEDEVRNRYNNAKEVIDNMSPDEVDRANTANSYERMNNTLQTAFNGGKTFFNANFKVDHGPEDISDAIRLGENAGTLSDKQRRTLSAYNIVKENLLNGAPELREDIENFEKNPNNKIPMDFEKVLGGRVQSILDERNEYINNTPNREKYEKAWNDLTNVKVELDNIESLKIRKDELSQDLAKVKENIADVKESSQGWKKYAKEVLGEDCPAEDKLTIDTAATFAKKLRIKCDDQIKHNYLEAFEIGNKMANEKNTLKKLKADLYPIKFAQLKNKIFVQQEIVDKATVLASDKKTLMGNITNINSRRLESQQGAYKILNGPFDTIGERLRNIYENFDKVQSFWSKGKSLTCKTMYDDLGKAVTILTSPGSKLEEIKDVLSTLQSSNKNYLDEKNAQNRAKIFSSEQRFWRLSLCEDINGIVGNSLNMVNRLEKDPQAKELINCTGLKQFELATKERNVELLFNEYTKRSTNKVMANKDVHMEKAPQGKEQKFEDINKVYDNNQQNQMSI